VASKISRSETSSLPASRARTPSPLSTHRVNQRHACTPSPRLSLRILPTSLSTCSSTVSSSNAPANTSIPSSSYHPFSCPHLDFAKAVKRASCASSSRSRGAAYETAPTLDYSSALSAQRESMYYSTAKRTLARSSEVLESVETTESRNASFTRSNNLDSIDAGSMSNVRDSSLPSSVVDRVAVAVNNCTVVGTSSALAPVTNAVPDSYVHFAQSEELLHASDAQTLYSKMDATVSHDYAYPNLPVDSTSSQVNRLWVCLLVTVMKFVTDFAI